ncbi:MAG TPA: LLM class flavin-dependent oxidoreductase, partial [Candidatus Kryptonia bacterium]|nr:LLM class flavin-dependent oxidoreductase [Candidatus Kryptonia bacterium]
ADREATRKSYELIARYVMPHFQGALESTARSRDWAADNRPEFIGTAVQAIMTEISKHATEQEEKIKQAS